MTAVLDICHHLFSGFLKTFTRNIETRGFGFKSKLIPGCQLNETLNYNGNSGHRTEVCVGAETLQYFLIFVFLY